MVALVLFEAMFCYPAIKQYHYIYDIAVVLAYFVDSYKLTTNAFLFAFTK
jgi:hypothetical protein